MKYPWLLLLLFLLCPVRGAVVVFVQATNGLANINYTCTAGETVRSFALDVSVDRGQIIAVTNFFRGLSTAAGKGYGVFPASFRDNVTVSTGSNANWNATGYSPLAVAADDPAGTLPGLNSSGVTLEFGALWDPTVPAAVPPASGTLCALQLNQPANVSIVANASRGGIIASPPEVSISPQFIGALVGPAITSAQVVDGVMTVRFQGGELESAPAVSGPWTGTGNTSGTYTETNGTFPAKFFRVHYH
jgi:hypothetical protein